MWDDINHSPVLFREEIYTQNPNLTIRAALNKAAKRRANELNLTLLSSAPSDKKYSNPLYSLDCRAPSEYVDALDDEDNITRSRWKLKKMYCVI